MITAILPVYSDKNPFWSSPEGLGCIDAFLASCRRIDEFDKILVITSDRSVESIAQKNGLEFRQMEARFNIDRQYTLEDSWRLAGRFQSLCNDLTDGLIIIDHRNCLVTQKTIRHAVSVFKKSTGISVIGIVPCVDYPIQYQSYYTFSDCVIFNLDTAREKSIDTCQNATLSNLAKQAEAQISIKAMKGHELGYRLSFQTEGSDIKEYVVQILPYTENGPDFKKSTEVFISNKVHEVIVDAHKHSWSGMIVILSVPSQTGEYNMVECFSPPRATWKLKTSRQQLFMKKNSKPMNGRQQFPDAYVYDGTFCAFRREALNKDLERLNPIPVILPRSRIVMDWVDYYYTVAVQQCGMKTDL